MNEQLTPAMQRRIQVLQHYMRAMESGDVDAIAAPGVVDHIAFDGDPGCGCYIGKVYRDVLSCGD